MSTNQEHLFGEAVGVYGPPTKNWISSASTADVWLHRRIR
jgi:hypothetical protein